VKILATVNLLLMLLTAAMALAATASAPSSLPPKGIEGPDVRHARVEGSRGLDWPYVR